MEQKLFIVRAYGSNEEIGTPEELQKLFDEGWQIKQISAFGYYVNGAQQRCVLLLERNK